jgi:hypothetical protein
VLLFNTRNEAQDGNLRAMSGSTRFGADRLAALVEELGIEHARRAWCHRFITGRRNSPLLTLSLRIGTRRRVGSPARGGQWSGHVRWRGRPCPGDCDARVQFVAGDARPCQPRARRRIPSSPGTAAVGECLLSANQLLRIASGASPSPHGYSQLAAARRGPRGPCRRERPTPNRDTCRRPRRSEHA